MMKRCFYTISAIMSCCALIAAEGDAVVIDAAVSCFKLPAGTKLNKAQALARETGFEYLTVYRQRIPTLIKL